ELKPILLSATTLKRASLQNPNETTRLDPRVGDDVLVEQGGEHTPQVPSAYPDRRPADSDRGDYIDQRPDGRTTLVRQEGEAAHYCPNTTGCPPQITGRIEHFIQRRAMDIDSLGERTIWQLYHMGLVKSPADLYDLTREDIMKLEGFKELSTQNLLK